METQIDGFVIANEDLKLRNTGQIYGVGQSGISDLVLLDIVKKILKKLRQLKILFINIYKSIMVELKTNI